MKDALLALPVLRALAAQAARALLAFAAPIVMLCIGLSVSGIYPFGAESFLTEDLKYQYIDFFTWYRKVLLGEESLFYTFALSLGNNAWGLWSYYLASPFNLIVALFPESSLVFAIFIITALKLGCIGLTSAYYLQRRFSLSFGQALVLSLCFSCSLWVFTQMRNPMWLDALILLPLVALGIWRCATEGRWSLLLASIVAAIVTCWYTAYMIVLFSILLALAEWAIARFDDKPPVGLARFVTLMTGVFCLALLLAAWTFYPTIAAQLGDWSSEKTLLLCGASVLLGALSVAFLGTRLSTRATAWA